MDNIGEVAVTQDERTMGTLAHVLQLVGWWIAPLIIYLVKRDSKFVSFHALQALLLQVVYLVIWIVVAVVCVAAMVGTVVSQGAAHSNQPPVALFVLMPVFGLVGMGGWLALLIVAIVYGIKAGRGEWAKYPIIGNWAARIVRINLGSPTPTGI